MGSLNNILSKLTEDYGTTGITIFTIAVTVMVMAIWMTAQWYRLSHIPGPFFASLTNIWAFRASMSGHYHVIVRDLQEKYGEIARIAPNDVLIADPDTLWKINSARSVWGRGDWYGSIRFNPQGDTVFTETDTAAHDKRKAKLISGFSGKGLVNIEGNIDIQLGILVDVLKRKVSGGNGANILDLGRLLQLFQVDLIALAGTGQSWGNLITDTDHYGYLNIGDDLLKFTQSSAMIPSVRHVLFSPLFLRLFGQDTRTGWLGALKTAVKRHTSDINDEKPRDTMLAEWLKHDLSPLQAELDLSIQLLAGIETSIYTIRGTLLYLMTAPRVYNKLKREIAEGIQNGRISTPIKGDEAKNLPYLQAVISEGLRISTPGTAGFPKRVPPGGEVICGKMLPAGTDVHVNFAALMTSREVFGDDADVFRPERFLEDDEETNTRRRKVVDLNFGFGRWLCLGKVLALLEMNKIFVEVS
ncbi:hypothetical protein PFICI_14709 [Pestalotiopsis fici W106-1]|uniref:Pisatin demethylase n=1 Tax=Pestalotiopsis fici (strain W106-1 / CGMCC3.15140) TaxID=1229662 RepID=W3WIS0_PESFW|nr:uncharacterized protein PFICI_14709 [Pestalotiopsis fici W106-1]ETS73763.1 hypothetical protein PFICI_14709 [Pestalotiopsis fici W106-1]